MHTDHGATPDHDTVAQHRSRRATAPRPGDTSSPEAPAAPRSRRRRRLGLLAGALVPLFLITGCNVPVSQGEGFVSGNGRIEDAEVTLQRQRIINDFVAAINAQRRAVQAHPFLSCVRAHESAGNYTAQNPSSSASGAYQFLDSTWQRVSPKAGYAGYARAAHAPWWAQDAVALWMYNNGGRSAWNGTGC